jgi:AcrR family transcriptional regulator
MDDLRAGPFSAAGSPARARLRDAAMELVVERGYEGVTLEMVLERAGVNGAGGSHDFADLRDLCTQIYLANIGEFDRLVFAAADRHREWRERLRAAAYTAAAYVRDRPLETRFDMIQMLQAGPTAQALRDRYVARIVDLIDEGRGELDDPDSVSRSVAEGVLGAIYGYVVKELQAGRGTDEATEMVPELMYIAVRPYVGHEAAREELTIPQPGRF